MAPDLLPGERSSGWSPGSPPAWLAFDVVDEAVDRGTRWFAFADVTVTGAGHRGRAPAQGRLDDDD